MRRFDGDMQAIDDLRPGMLEKLLDGAPLPDVPTVSLVTSTRSFFSPLAFLAMYLGIRRDRSSDGAVPYRDQAVPHSDVVSLRGLDHADVTNLHPLPRVDKRALTLALTDLLVRKIEEPRQIDL